ncbi:MAG: asparagine synthase (glutamine-hydrolyzing), partial [Lentisphaerota bacterium]
MCGICGFNWQNKDLIHGMQEIMHHRGPDQHGIYCDPDMSLGHRRLSIIDLSEQGRQPMTNEDGSLQVVFNGEIYNFQDIKTGLEKKGHQFRSHSDTEVILHAYEEYGLEAVHQFRGMFAFALWDRNKKRLWLVRDRIGIKPLYYYWNAGKLIFASEIKAILQDPLVPRELNHQALYAYLGFEFVPAPDTMFNHIHKIPAGHYLVHENGQIQVTEYWDLTYPQIDNPQTTGEMIEHIRALLDESVKLRLISDVPLGSFLSGGLDSSTRVAMMR